MTQYYVSVTGLTLKSIWCYPKFMYYAVPCVMEAEKAEGNVSTRTQSLNGVQHTLTVWEGKLAMRKFFVAGAHRKAMAITAAVADLEKTKVYGYESDTIPTWDEAIELWEKYGKLHGSYPATKKEVMKSPTQERSPRPQNLIYFYVVAAVLAIYFLSKSEVTGYYLKSKFAMQ